MNKKPFNATTLRIILLVTLLLLVASIIAAGYYAQLVLSNKAQAVDRTRIESEFALEEISLLQKLRNDLENHENTIEKAANIVAVSQSYRYQNQIISDINRYADQANVRVTGYDFSSDTSNPAKQPKSMKAAKPLSVVVRTAEDTEYDSFLRFLRFIEENNTKLQLTGVNLLPNQDKRSLLMQTSLELEVYIR